MVSCVFANDPKEYLVVGSAYVREEVRWRSMRFVMLLLLAVMIYCVVARRRSAVDLSAGDCFPTVCVRCLGYHVGFKSI